MTPDVNVVLLDFPQKGREMIVENEDGSFTILINSRHSQEAQLMAYNHAMKHIKNMDFEKTNVQKIEYAAHTIGLAESMERIPSKRYLNQFRALKQKSEMIKRQLSLAESNAYISRNMRGGYDWEVPNNLQWFSRP